MLGGVCPLTGSNSIRPLVTEDRKKRRLSGRHQISTDGKHLIDGIAFGRPRLRTPRDRPPIEIPPLKRRRLTDDDGEDNEEQDEDFLPLLLTEHGERHGEQRKRVRISPSVRDAHEYQLPHSEAGSYLSHEPHPGFYSPQQMDEEEYQSSAESVDYEHMEDDPEELDEELRFLAGQQDLEEEQLDGSIVDPAVERLNDGDGDSDSDENDLAADPANDADQEQEDLDADELERQLRDLATDTAMMDEGVVDEETAAYKAVGFTELGLKTLDKITALRAAFPSASAGYCEKVLQRCGGDEKKAYKKLTGPHNANLTLKDMRAHYHRLQADNPAPGHDDAEDADDAEGADNVDDAEDSQDSDAESVDSLVKHYDQYGFPAGSIMDGTASTHMVAALRMSGQDVKQPVHLRFEDDVDTSASSRTVAGSGQPKTTEVTTGQSAPEQSQSTKSMLSLLEDQMDDSTPDEDFPAMSGDSSSSSNKDSSDSDSGPEVASSKKKPGPRDGAKVDEGSSSDIDSDSSSDSDSGPEVAPSKKTSGRHVRAKKVNEQEEDSSSSSDSDSSSDSSSESDSDDDDSSGDSDKDSSDSSEDDFHAFGGNIYEKPYSSAGSGSDSSSVDSSSESEQEPVRKKAKTHASSASKTTSSVPSSTSLAVKAPGPAPSAEIDKSKPGEGTTATQRRNARRREAAKAKKAAARDAALGAAGTAEFEAKRAALLQSLALMDESPMEVSGPSAGDQQDTTPASSQRKSKLDVGAGRRMVFGSLGLKNPKSNADEDQIRSNLMKDVRVVPNARLESADAPAHQPEADDSVDWRQKINYRAVECCEEDVELSEPPFPFVQRWDPQQRKGWKKKGGNKRKLQNQDYEEEDSTMSTKKTRRHEHDDYDNSYYDDSYYTTGNQTDNDVTLNYDDDVTLNYDDEVLPDERIHEPSHVYLDEDLPCIPDDVSVLPVLHAGDAKPGMVITWKQLLMSKATNWQPQMLSLVGLVDEVFDSDSFRVQLAKRDRNLDRGEKTYDEEGNRVYDKFEVPDMDEDLEDGAEEGYRTLEFDDLLEPRVLRCVDDDVETAKEPEPEQEDDESQPPAPKPLEREDTDQTATLDHEAPSQDEPSQDKAEEMELDEAGEAGEKPAQEQLAVEQVVVEPVVAEPTVEEPADLVMEEQVVEPQPVEQAVQEQVVEQPSKEPVVEEQLVEEQIAGQQDLEKSAIPETSQPDINQMIVQEQVVGPISEETVIPETSEARVDETADEATLTQSALVETTSLAVEPPAEDIVMAETIEQPPTGATVEAESALAQETSITKETDVVAETHIPQETTIPASDPAPNGLAEIDDSSESMIPETLRTIPNDMDMAQDSLILETSQASTTEPQAAQVLSDMGMSISEDRRLEISQLINDAGFRRDIDLSIGTGIYDSLPEVQVSVNTGSLLSKPISVGDLLNSGESEPPITRDPSNLDSNPQNLALELAPSPAVSKEDVQEPAPQEAPKKDVSREAAREEAASQQAMSPASSPPLVSEADADQSDDWEDEVSQAEPEPAASSQGPSKNDAPQVAASQELPKQDSQASTSDIFASQSQIMLEPFNGFSDEEDPGTPRVAYPKLTLPPSDTGSVPSGRQPDPGYQMEGNDDPMDYEADEPVPESPSPALSHMERGTTPVRLTAAHDAISPASSSGSSMDSFPSLRTLSQQAKARRESSSQAPQSEIAADLEYEEAMQQLDDDGEDGSDEFDEDDDLGPSEHDMSELDGEEDDSESEGEESRLVGDELDDEDPVHSGAASDLDDSYHQEELRIKKESYGQGLKRGPSGLARELVAKPIEKPRPQSLSPKKQSPKKLSLQKMAPKPVTTLSSTLNKGLPPFKQHMMKPVSSLLQPAPRQAGLSDNVTQRKPAPKLDHRTSPQKAASLSAHAMLNRPAMQHKSAPIKSEKGVKSAPPPPRPRLPKARVSNGTSVPQGGSQVDCIVIDSSKPEPEPVEDYADDSVDETFDPSVPTANTKHKSRPSLTGSRSMAPLSDAHNRHNARSTLGEALRNSKKGSHYRYP